MEMDEMDEIEGPEDGSTEESEEEKEMKKVRTEWLGLAPKIDKYIKAVTGTGLGRKRTTTKRGQTRRQR